MNKEYVEKEATLELSKFFNCKNGNKHFVWGIETYAEYLQKLPPANVKPVVRGEWRTDGCAANGHSDIYCSVCNKEATYFVGSSDEIHWSEKYPAYCPNCGADMREG